MLRISRERHYYDHTSYQSQDLTSIRALDLFLSCVLLFILAPVMVLIAALIALDTRGPVIFRQTRTGRNGRTFKIYKFRTMTVTEDGDSVRQVTRCDCRITRVGAVLRSSSLDELPQLINVVLGDMSLVGPRPHATKHDEYYGARLSGYWRRYQVRPGMTGLAQIRGFRGETACDSDMAERLRHDLDYVDHVTVRSYLATLIRTPWSLLIHKAF
jgi:putative colanic acid biosynthesis UDP-glucose lipid carrier transferase